MGEQHTYGGWRRAVRALWPDAVFEGNRDIASAFVGGARDNWHCVGEWDGACGVALAVPQGIRPLSAGYAFELTAMGADWRSCSAELWQTTVISGREAAASAFVGWRRIDGARCAVWRYGVRYFAQTAL